MKGDVVWVLDFGGQYTHLIARRVRECGIYSEIVPHDVSPDEVLRRKPKGLILSGSPASAYEEEAPKCDLRIYELGIPILGICYGIQLIAQQLGGKVVQGAKREYGRIKLTIKKPHPLFEGFGREFICWMSHGDYVEKAPEGFEVIASTENTPIAAMVNDEKRIYGVQFHPEVTHTERGIDIFRNFLFHICGCTPSWSMESFVEKAVEEIKRLVGDERVICALSGGVDSSTTAVLVHKAIGDRLTCIFIDHGLMRENEPQQVLKVFKEQLNIPLIFVDARERFLSKLRGVSDPEEKRRIVGEEFIRVFEEVAEEIGGAEWLAQGTLYPDVIESAAVRSPASRIKSHHNVAALPKGMKLKLLEPLRNLYKDEVRKVAELLGLPKEIVRRHPFPGPGLAVRIIGEVTEKKLKICRRASAIVEEELQKAGWYDRVWQAFAIVGDDKAVGVKGDERHLGYVVMVRVVESVDGMTADWAQLPHEVLRAISNRITNEIPEVSWVTYAISSKPPSTIEPC